MNTFAHQRHKSPRKLSRERELVIVCPPLRSNVNLSRIVRVAGCFGVAKVIACRPFTIDPEIARDSVDIVHVEPRQSLPPVLKRLKQESYTIVGLEQATNSTNLFEFTFARRTALVLGHERLGIDEPCLALCDFVAEIPVYGRPSSLNVASAATVAIYEYCRQFPSG